MKDTTRCFAIGHLLKCLALIGAHASAMAQLPPPPVSPAPIVDFEYDAQGNFTKSIQGKNVPGFNISTRHEYDGLGRRFRSTDARGKFTSFSRTGLDELLQVTDPRNLTTTYPRNGLGDLTGLNSPDTGAATHSFDAAGNLKTRLDSRGALASYGYDALNRLTSVTHAQPGQASQVFTWTYDQTGPGFSNGIGRLTSTQFPAGSANYAYDPQGRLVLVTQTVTADSTVRLSVGYGYDAAGHVTSIMYPSGRTLLIPHSGGQPVGMSLAGGRGPALPMLDGLKFDAAPGATGAVRSWLWQLNSGSMANNREFDIHGRMVRYPLGGAVRDLSYDAADRISSYTHWNALSGTAVAALDQAFAYDELGRLTGISSGVGSWAIAYDDNGNRTVVRAYSGNGSSTRNYIVSPGSNQLLGIDNPTRAIASDAVGNIAAQAEGNMSLSFGIDAANRIASISGTPDGVQFSTTAYGYNAFGQRVLKKAVSVGRPCTDRTERANCGDVAAPPRHWSGVHP
jgi:YD repeat-containing protein